ncbi:MAG: zinc-dependent metalloprotease [Deltaproteobacteria bacterium]|nr:zinc-dependent metalloprotease [Deltaproteobacteria bacterium]
MRNLKTVVLAGLLVAAFGCAQEIGDVNRVQPDYIKKSDLTGEWYFLPTIVETQYNQGIIFEGYPGTMEKIRWEIQEGALLGYRSYAAQPGLDGISSHGSEGIDQPGSAVPIVGFAITSHFDIRRQYNPSTGVENNVLEENTSDNPWWEREYMRVDWSTSVIDNPLDIAGFATAYYSSYRDYISEVWESDPNRLRILPGYIDAVINVGLMVDMETCYYEFADWIDWCGGSEAKLRMSFRKVAPDNDYQPQEYPDYLPVQYRLRYRDSTTALPCDPTPSNTATCINIGTCVPSTTEEEDPFCREQTYDLYVSSQGYICDETFNPDDCYQYYIPIFENYGYFRTTRWLFDADRGYRLDGRQFLINRFNIWERSRDENGDWIPQAERTTKPVVWYLGTHFPGWLVPVAQRMMDQWDLALRGAVAAARGIDWDRGDFEDLRAKVPAVIYELRPNGCSPDNILAYAKDNDLEDVVVRVAGGLDKIAAGNLERVCAALEYNSYGKPTPFEWQRPGDLRYNVINWIDTDNVAAPLGMSPSFSDPETGEIVNAMLNLYGPGIRNWARYYADLVSLMNGDISETEVIGGEYIRAAIEAGRAKQNNSLSSREVARIMQQVDQRMAGISGEAYLTPAPPDDHGNRMNLIAGSSLERELLINDEVLRAAAGPRHYQPGQDISEEALRMASPSRWSGGTPPSFFLPNDGKHLDLKSVLGNEQRLTQFFMNRNIEMPDFYEPALIGLAHKLRDKSREEVFTTIMETALQQLSTHEMGHNLGLRHNFAGSNDALNYPSEYWAIKALNEDPAVAYDQVDRLTWVSAATRDKFKAELQSCVPTDLTSQDCLNIEEYTYATVMDYGQRINQWGWHGVGYYDLAAIKFGYAMVREIFDERGGAFLGDQYDISQALYLQDYTDIPKLLSNTDMGAVWNDAINAISDVTTQVVTLPPGCDLDGNPPPGCVAPDCTCIPVNYGNMYKRRDVSFTDWVDDYHRNIFTSGYDTKLREVPYTYCSDAYAWGGNLFCNMWDAGANVQEIVKNATELYDHYYLFSNFKRDRFNFGDFYSYINRLYSRTFQPIRYAYNYYFYYRHSQSRIWPLINDWATAAFNGLNFLGSILQMPEPGNYCLCTSNCMNTDLRPLPDNTYVPMTGSTCPSGQPITVGMGSGRYYNTIWTPDYFYRPLVIGSFWDKLLVLETMTDSSAYFARDISGWFDRGSYSITYYRVFSDEMIELFKGLMEGDASHYASEVREIGGKKTVVPRNIVGDQPPNPQLIVPSDNYFMRFYAMYFSVYGLTSTVDRHLDFVDRARVHLAGEYNEPDYSGFLPSEMAVFTNPQNNLTYRAAPIDALRDDGGNIVNTDRSIGYTYVVKGRDFVTNVWQPAKTALETAQTACDADADCNSSHPNNANWIALIEAEDQFSDADHRLTDISENLDILRLFTNYLPFSNL